MPRGFRPRVVGAAVPAKIGEPPPKLAIAWVTDILI